MAPRAPEADRARFTPGPRSVSGPPRAPEGGDPRFTASPRSLSVAIVIPAYNEATAIGSVVGAARRHAPVLVIDDGSDDGNASEAAGAGAEVVRHERRRGKSEALRTGIAAARARGATHVVTLDGDGQHDPHDIPTLLRATAETPDAIIVGGRLADERPFSTSRLNAIRVAGFFVEWVSGLGLRDTQSGFRVYPVALFDDIEVRGQGFVFETEVLIAAAGRGWQVREVPVAPIPRAGRPSRFQPLGDGVAIGRYLAGRVMAQWGVEMATAMRALGGVRWHERAARGEVSPVAAWDHARRRRSAVVALATVASPLLLTLAVTQALVKGRLPDLLTPLVRRLYSGERLVAAGMFPGDAGRAEGGAVPAPGGVD